MPDLDPDRTAMFPETVILDLPSPHLASMKIIDNAKGSENIAVSIIGAVSETRLPSDEYPANAHILYLEIKTNNRNMALQKFLCFDIRTGVLVLSIFHLISSVFFAAVHFILSLDDTDPESASMETFYLGGDLFSIFLNGSLAYGLHKELRAFLLPYLIFGGLIFAIATLLCIVFLIFAPVVIVLLLILLGFYWYFWYAVLSLYQMLDPQNPNYVPQQATTVYIEDAKPPAYYENSGAEAV